MLEIWTFVFILIWIQCIRNTLTSDDTKSNLFTFYFVGLTLIGFGILYNIWFVLQDAYNHIANIKSKTPSPMPVQIIDNIPGTDPIDVYPSTFSIVLYIIVSLFFLIGLLYLGYLFYDGQLKHKSL